MGVLKTKGLRPLGQNRFHSQHKCSYAQILNDDKVRFSKIRGMLELNQNKSANRKTGELTAYFTRATGKAVGTQQNTGVSQSPGKICKHCTMQKILVQVDNLQQGKIGQT
jgi:hypothetical protein